MPIKNKDGTLFRLEKPNPVVTAQSLWNEDENPIITHNFTFSDKITYSIYVEEEEEEELDFTIPQPKETTYVPPKPKKLKTESLMIPAYCLPANISVFTDPLYGQTKTKILYGDQFTFDVIFIARNDLSVQLWSKTPVTIGSIIFIPSDSRWWKVQGTEPGNDGIMIMAGPSELTPSFRL